MVKFSSLSFFAYILSPSHKSKGEKKEEEEEERRLYFLVGCNN